MNISLAVDNTKKLDKETSQRIQDKAMLIAEIINLKNDAEKRRNEYFKTYADLMFKGDLNECLKTSPNITEFGGRMRAFDECLLLINKYITI